jgi:uncharacterized RDD family membrane protein YckC
MHADILDAPAAPVQKPLEYTRGRDRLIAGVADFILLKGLGYALTRISIYYTFRFELTPAIIAGLEMICYVFIVKSHGGTPGKLFLNMKILTAHGHELTWYHVCMRYLPQFIIQASNLTLVFFWQDINLFLYQRSLVPHAAWTLLPFILTVTWIIISIFLTLTDEKRRSLNDRIAGTVVIVRKK